MQHQTYECVQCKYVMGLCHLGQLTPHAVTTNSVLTAGKGTKLCEMIEKAQAAAVSEGLTKAYTLNKTMEHY